MSYLFPLFFAALASLLIPIIIHLFNFRRYKKVLFTNVKFLKEVKEETSSRSRLKHILVLLSRLFALAFLVMAFVQPFIPKADSEVITGAKAYSIYLDNSFSMKAQSAGVALMEKAKLKAREIVQAFQPEDRMQLITNDFEGKHQRLVDREEFLSYLDEVVYTPNVRTMGEVVQRQKQILEKSDAQQKSLFLISDFQKSTAEFENDTAYNYFLLPLQSAEQQNVYIDSLWSNAPVLLLNETNELLVRIQNTGNIDVENSRMVLKINDQTKAIVDVDIKSKASVIDTVTFTLSEGGWNNAELGITDYPVDFDDDYYFTFYIEEKVKVLSINQSSSNKYLKAAFAQQDLISLENKSVNQLNYAELASNRLIILNGLKNISSGLAFELEEYLKGGGNVMVFPHLSMNAESYNSFLRKIRANTYDKLVTEERPLDFINVKQEVFKDVFTRIPNNIDLPVAKKSFDLSRFSNAGEEVLLSMRGGNSFMGKYNVEQGKLYLMAAPLDNDVCNLPSHSIFVPMIFKTALLGGDVKRHDYVIGEDEFVETTFKRASAENVLKMKGPSDEFIPGQKAIGSKLLLSMNNQLKESGFYNVYEIATEPLAHFGFNYSRKESKLDYFTPDDLTTKFSGENIAVLDNADANLTSLIGTYDRGQQLWKWCLIFTLIFLAIEMLLLRLWKT